MSVGKRALRYFLKTLGVIFAFILAGVLSYFGTLFYYKQTDADERCTKYTHVIDINVGNESSNLIFSFNETDKVIDAIVLENFDVSTHNLSYFTIPANTTITLPSNKYSEYTSINKSIPRIVKLSDVPKYFKGDVAFEYAIKILQEELKVDIGYFTAIPSDRFSQYFDIKGTGKKRYSPTKEVLQSLNDNPTKDDIEEYMEDNWNNMISDITLNQKKNYAEALSKVNPNFIRTYKLFGTNNGVSYILDAKRSKRLINKVWEKNAFTRVQSNRPPLLSDATNVQTQASSVTKPANVTARPEDVKNELAPDNSDTVSENTNLAKGHPIKILNSTGVNGLAAKYKKMMEKDNLSILGVDNYTGGKIVHTKILVRKQKWGASLKKYFKNATVQTSSNLAAGTDIEVVIGTEDAR